MWQSGTLWLFVIDLTWLVSDPVVIMHKTGPLICDILNSAFLLVLPHR